MSDQGPDFRLDRERVSLVELTRPDVVRLATAVSLAVRVEPALLRQARLVLEPDLGVATEAELWFSSLVSSYSPRALLLHPGVAAVLRDRLAGDPEKLRAARAIVKQIHVSAAPTIRLEEEVLYAALAAEDPDQVELQLGRALNTMQAMPDRADALARWAVRAWRSLPSAATVGDTAHKLIATSLWRVQGGIEVGVDLTERGILVSQPPTPTSKVISLPPTGADDPAQLRVRPAESDQPAEPIAVQPGTSVEHRIAGSGLDLSGLPGVRHQPSGFDIETADGRVFELRPAPVAEGPVRLSAVDRADIQGNVLRAYGSSYPCTAYVFVGIGEVGGGRAWLREITELVSSDEEWRDVKPPFHHNVALTCAGLRALGVPEAVIATFSDEFRQGMAARSAMLGDLGASASSHWEAGLGTGAAHVLVIVNARSRYEIESELANLRDSIELAPGVSIVHEQFAELLAPPSGDASAPPREQFGFSDGAAQPAIAGVSDGSAAGGGVPLANGGWRALALGEFVLGYPDEDTLVDPHRRLPSAPADPLGQSGTYMVYRKLRQDVALFRRTLRDAAARFSQGDEELLAAKVVGRWRNGTPLVTSPYRPDPSFSATAAGSNSFRYLDVDADGRRCPLGAHIRRSNPRDALGWPGLDDAGLLSFRHRIIRRGVPYGPPLPAGVLEDDGRDRGLLFVCFNASISRQFESVQLQWLNDGNGFHLGHDSDFLLGSPWGTGKMTVQGDPPFMLAPQGQLVTTRGGEYLFVPGIAALRAIADGIGTAAEAERTGSRTERTEKRAKPPEAPSESAEAP
ncbi:MAG TPA: hypothetical protein VMB27_22460 [Solirubrobacteraceae bacterium]|nr:hypothetical protein [Solirubrobacteraceae bacterium]